MARIIAVTNLKGGIGKTTTVVNVGAGLALKGARVLLIDVDAQGNLAPALGLNPRRTIYEVLVDNVSPEKCITHARPNLDLIAADDSLLGAQNEIARRSDWSRVLEKALRSIRSSYDFIFVDAPGSLTALSVNAIAASSDLLVPTTVEHLSIKGLRLLFRQVARIKNNTSSIRLIVPTMFDARISQSALMFEQLKSSYGALIASPIRVNVRLSEAISQGRTIYEYDPRSRGALDYAYLVNRLSKLWGFQSPARKPAVAPATNGSREAAVPPPDQAQKPAAQTIPSVSAAPPRPDAATSTEATGQPARSPLVTGAASKPQHTCPHCGGTLQRATIAGYRVTFCNHCRYKQQELVSRSRQ